MLNNFVLPASVSSGHAIEGVQPIQGFAPYNQLTELMPAFKLAEDGGKPDDEEKKDTDVQKAVPDKDEEKSLPEIFKLAFNVSFKEMIELFLVPEHDKILDIRAKFRNERDVDELTIFAPKGKVPAEFEKLRDQLYEFQMQLFNTPRGLHCHIIL